MNVAVQPSGPQEEMNDVQGIPLSEEAQRAMRTEEFASVLLRSRMEAIQWRESSGVEQRWYEDLCAYHGVDAHNRPAGIVETAAAGVTGVGVASSSRTSAPAQARSTIYVQLTRQKTNAAAARVADMLFPSDEPNWSIGPTPEVQLVDAVREHRAAAWIDRTTGQPLEHPDDPSRVVTIGDVSSEKLQEAARRAERMTKAIADKLEECNYTGRGRQIIMDAAKYGTGIIKGPVIVNAVRKAWQQVKDATGALRTIQFKQDTKPASFVVSVWDFYPDPACGESIQDASYTWERERVSKRSLRRLARTKGYDAAAINECLLENPNRASSTNTLYEQASRMADGTTGRGSMPFNESRYELWTYCGEVTRQNLEDVGIAVPEEMGELASLSAIVVFCNDRIIKTMMNPMDGGDLPYDLFPWETVAHSPWGVGVPYLMRYAQRTINAAWRALLDNMGASSGVQIIMSTDVVPIDGSYTIVGRKVWTAPSGRDVDKSFKVFEIPSRQAELQNVIKLAMEFADAETSLPQIAQGEQGSAPDTVGGMTLLMNAATTVLKRLARQFDDYVTKPHIRRYYDWMMQYHPDDAIKGDMEIAARGSSSLVQRDQRNQNITEVLAAATHPVFGKFLSARRLFETYLESKSIPTSVMATDAEIAKVEEDMAKAGPPKSPQEKVAEIKAAAELKAIKVETDSEVTNEKLRQENAERDRDHDFTMKLLDYRTKLLDYAHQRGISLTDLKNEMSMFVLEKSFEREQAALDRASQSNERGADRAHEMTREAVRASQKQPAEA